MPKARPELILTADVARRLEVDVRTVHRMVRRGELVPAMKVPGLRGALLFDAAEVARIEKVRAA